MAGNPLTQLGPPPEAIRPYFRPGPEGAGRYRSPLFFEDGTLVRTREQWTRRRSEIVASWHRYLGAWPKLLEQPRIQVLAEARRDGYTEQRVRLPSAPGHESEGYLLIPNGKGPFPAVVVVFYDAETAVRPEKAPLDFAYQLVRRGIAALSMGTPSSHYYPSEEKAALQPLSSLAYAAANWHTALAARPEVRPDRIGVIGHSYGGKWAMFAAALHEKFACAAVSDPGIVFDEARPNVNYWEPWYLGWDPDTKRRRGVITADNPRTGAYKRLVEDGRDLHEIHALLAPRPFLVSGGSEDPAERWTALGHMVAVNRLLGFEDRVAMTNRPGHTPTAESNQVLFAFLEWALRP